MRLVKYTHACVRLERDGDALVIDPGAWSEPEAVDGARAVLVTHEHADHVDPDRLRKAAAGGATVYAPAGVAVDGVSIEQVAPGDEFTAAGFRVRAVGGEHAEIYDGLPGIANIGYVVDGVYHPGDSLYVTDAPVDTLLVPVSGPWLKLGEALAFAKVMGATRVYPIHDALNTEVASGMVGNWFKRVGVAGYARLRPGESAEV